MGVDIWCCWGCLDGYVWPDLGAGLEVRCLSCLPRFRGGLLCVRGSAFSLSLSLLFFTFSLYHEEDVVIVASCAVLFCW